MNCPHCDVHIDEHEASRCLDVWVAEAVMEIELHVHEPSDNGQHCKHCHLNKSYVEFGTKWGRPRPPRYYSINISAAWELVEKFRKEMLLLPIWSLAMLGNMPLAICRESIRIINAR